MMNHTNITTEELIAHYNNYNFSCQTKGGDGEINNQTL